MAKRYDMARKYTKKYHHLLSPCKYCGNTNIHITSDRICGKYEWSVTCSTRACDYTSDSSLKRAIQKWNKRHTKTDVHSKNKGSA